MNLKFGDATVDIHGLFSGQKQYKIPFYQRRYVWDQKNWDPLWEDIRQLPKKHFAGTIITYEQADKSVEIVDGQQRLTTFQIIFCVIRDLWNLYYLSDSPYEVSSSANITDWKAGIEKYIKKDIRRSYSEESNTKPPRILLTERDKQEFDSVFLSSLCKDLNIQGTPKVLDFSKLLQDEKQHLIIKAYGFFGSKIITHLDQAKNSADRFDLFEEFKKLGDTLKNFHVILAELDSESGYDPEEVFQIINDTGRMLDDFDYLRNYLFLRTRKHPYAENIEKLYNDHWDKFEDWDSKKLNSFFKTFLMAKLGPTCFEGEDKNIQPFDCYRKHKDTLEGPNQEFIPLLQLSRYADTYEEFYYDLNGPKPVETYLNLTEIANRMQFYEDLDLPRLDWFLLFMKHASESSDSELFEKCEEDLPGQFSTDMHDCCAILESYIVRRWLCSGEYEASYKEINNFFSKSFSNTGQVNLKNLVEHLSDSWPCPEKVKIVLSKYTYNNINSNLVRYILFRVELFREEYSLPHFDSTSELKQIKTGTNIYIYNIKNITSDVKDWIDEDNRIQEFLENFDQIWKPNAKDYGNAKTSDIDSE